MTAAQITIVVSLIYAAMAVAPTAARSEPSHAAAPAAAQRDGSQDFDWEIGRWTTDLGRDPRLAQLEGP